MLSVSISSLRISGAVVSIGPACSVEGVPGQACDLRIGTGRGKSRIGDSILYSRYVDSFYQPQIFQKNA